MRWLTHSWRELIYGALANGGPHAPAVLCGAMVGIERARKETPVGFRTLTLVSIGATIVTMEVELSPKVPTRNARSGKS